MHTRGVCCAPGPAPTPKRDSSSLTQQNPADGPPETEETCTPHQEPTERTKGGMLHDFGGTMSSIGLNWSVQAEAGEKGAKSDCLTYMAELSQVTTQLENANEKSKLLTSELKEKVQNVAQDSMLLTLSG